MVLIKWQLIALLCCCISTGSERMDGMDGRETDYGGAEAYDIDRHNGSGRHKELHWTIADEETGELCSEVCST